MLRTTLFTALAGILLSASARPHGGEDKPAPLTPQGLNITTLAANAKRESTIECWTIADLAVSSTPGIQGALVAPLATPKALNYFTIPGKFDGGLHNAPVVQ